MITRSTNRVDVRVEDILHVEIVRDVEVGIHGVGAGSSQRPPTSSGPGLLSPRNNSQTTEFLGSTNWASTER